MADDSHWSAQCNKISDEPNSLLIHAQVVGVHHPAGDHEAVVISGHRILGGDIHRLGMAVLPPNHIGGGRDHREDGARLVDVVPRARQFAIFEPVRCDKRNMLSVQCSHGTLLQNAATVPPPSSIRSRGNVEGLTATGILRERRISGVPLPRLFTPLGGHSAVLLADLFE